MSYLKVIISLACALTVVAAAVESDISRLEAKFDLLSSEILQLKNKNSELESEVSEVKEQNSDLAIKNSKLETEVSKVKEQNAQLGTEVSKMKTELDSTTPLITFDCYITSSWSTPGIIIFDGCAVDLTTEDPWKGSFTVPTEGIWKFSFMGTAYLDDGEYGSVYLKIDGTTVAYSYVNPAHTGLRVHTLSINTIQSVAVGQTVSLEWYRVGGNPYLYGDGGEPAHWSAVYLGDFLPPAPECEYVGQV